VKYKYGEMKPLYLVFGDFNLVLENTLPDECLKEWEVHPTAQVRYTLTERKALRTDPVDYFLVSSPFTIISNIDAKEFSPLPLTANGEDYRCSSDMNGEPVTFTREDLKNKNVALIGKQNFENGAEFKNRRI
jgi:hypothetical protein